MRLVLAEGLLFILALVALGALIAYAALEFTPLGARLRETSNRRRLEREAALVCPVHGRYDEAAVVRLKSGARMCPACYQEVLDE